MSPARRRWALVGSLSMVMLAVFAQVADDAGWIDDPWLPIGAAYLSSAAVGIDAIVAGVRRERGVGPSIANLAPGGWALFCTMLGIVAFPAYFFGARRRASRPSFAVPEQYEPVGPGSYIAIIIVASIGLFTAMGRWFVR